jgi:ubiquinol-cytochrome c reductase cytochrome c subunit
MRGLLSSGLLLAGLVLVPACCCQQPTPEALSEGQQIFQDRCATCHGEHGEGRSASISYAGPSLQAEHDPGKVMAAVEVGPEHMPRFEYTLSVDQMRAVSEYVAQKLAVIQMDKSSLTDGGELFRTYCSTCHRTAVRGGALGFVGTNAPSLVDKSPEIIAGAIRWGPGPMPKFPPSVLSDEQVASIVRYIQTVQHPANPGGDPLHWYGPTSEGFAAWTILLILILFTMWAERGGQG